MGADDLKLAIKDRLRAARYVVRETQRRSPIVPEPINDLVDGVLVRAEHAVKAIARPGLGDLGAARALALFMPPARRPAVDLPVHTAFYRIAGGLLALHGVDNAYVSERAIAEGFAGWRFGGLEPDAAAAAAALAFRSVRPIRRAEGRAKSTASADLNLLVGLEVGLAVAAAGRLAEPGPLADLLPSAVLAREAAFDRLERALAAPHPARALADAFGSIAPYLP